MFSVLIFFPGRAPPVPGDHESDDAAAEDQQDGDLFFKLQSTTGEHTRTHQLFLIFPT